MYNASKYAIEAIADCLRVELQPFGVQVALIEPGVIDTDPWREIDELLDHLEASLDPEHRALYAPHFAGERQLVGKIRRNAKPPERVAVAVERQLNRRRTRPRTLVGTDARTILGMKMLLSARRLDSVWAQSLKSPSPTLMAPSSPAGELPRRVG
jgi:NAD(P)-dependent dehydrogenase (short-subunit alcohol dehydrogenase family)